MSDDNGVEIRPNVSMYTAFARLNYEPWYALAEFVDNAVQSYRANLDALREHDRKAFRLHVGISITEDKIEIRDNAAGIALVDFSRAFSPASPPPDTSGLSEFGLGMKAAACWFAQRWSVKTAALGEGIEREVVYDIPQITRQRLERLPVGKSECWPTEHYTHVTLEALNVSPKTGTIAKIKQHLASIYRKFLREESMELRVQGDPLVYGRPSLLHAPREGDIQGATIEWRKEVDVDLGEGRRVTGWAGLMAKGSTANAGFALFRRGRLIEGSHGEAYRPEFIFGRTNSFAYQRLVGELDVEGFSVSHTKDGIQWNNLEEEFHAKLRHQLDEEPIPLLWQAQAFRKQKATVLPFLTTADAPADAAPIVGQRVLPLVAEPEPPATTEVEDDSSLKTDQLQYETSLSLYHQGQHWRVTIEVVSDQATDEWLDIGEEQQEADARSLHIRLNVAHPFLQRFISPCGDEITAYVRLGAALAVSEATARAAGVRQAGSIRRSLNQILREALSGPVQLVMPRASS
jgi:hypothetical protein